ncbi:sugar ABC transporter substrate-binding protein [Streptomyces sp. NBC_00102]|uniref:sugar ABC transporter substrate-binding protein n=1 Tax=Streptomyces sp. NBC_00102 TaxID=2975652 RepID=UPI002257B391|nr:sugar ABC transporter substrate-binding protein [Streptomyces sp. NBC_00102]MCX5400246.1 sugar ABC transporter substrate-binding protein [Streptomyces sp. NBC_00102]
MTSSPRSIPGRLAAAAALASLLVGCSASDDSAGGDDGSTTIGFVNGAETVFHGCLQKAIEQSATSRNAHLVVANSRQNPVTELSNIEDLIARHVDELIVQTVDVDTLDVDVAKARAAGIPIFLTSVDVDDLSGVLGAVVVDLGRLGALDAGWLEKDAAGRNVKVGVIAGAPGAASDLMVAGFEEALPANAKLVSELPGMFDPVKARESAQDMIEAYPDLDYAFVANEEMALSARQVFDAAGADVKIVTVNGTDEGLQAVKDGRLSATVANSASNLGRLAVQNSLGLMAGSSVEKVTSAPILLVTRANVDEAPAYCS